MFESICDTLTDRTLSCCVANNGIKSINLSFSTSDFVFKEKNGMHSIDSDRFQLYYLCDTLNPQLPFLIKYVLIDSNKDYDSFSYTYTYQDSVINDNMLIKNNDYPYLNTSSFSQCSTIPHLTNRLDVFPTNIVEYTGTYISDGYKFVGFIIYPFQYDKTSRKLALIKSITININLVIGQSVVPYSGKSTREFIKDIVCNKQDVDIQLERNDDITDYEYLIITDSLLLSPFRELAKWKTTKGVRAKVLTIEEISNNYLGQPYI